MPEGPPSLAHGKPTLSESSYLRLWSVFMTARVVTAAVLLATQGVLRWITPPVDIWSLGVVALYFVLALVWRIVGRAPRRPSAFAAQWLFTVGVDVLACAVVQGLALGQLNYGALFALPVLQAAVLGTRLLGLGTAAAATLALLGLAGWVDLHAPGIDASARLVQAGLTGAGLFLIALLAHELATRLAREEQIARRSQRSVVVQAHAHELVIENLADGVLVVDTALRALSANPAAMQMLGQLGLPAQLPLRLLDRPAWEPLVALVERALASGESQTADVSLRQTGQGQRQLHVRARLAAVDTNPSSRLCVLFIQDTRAMQARLRAEKLVSMGRMSMAVAHEIRNPLAAILQANALLDEDLVSPAHKRLAGIVRDNAQRLASIAEEILDLGRTREPKEGISERLMLDEQVRVICADWRLGASSVLVPELHLGAGVTEVEFGREHLRRVMVNLLDNARRHASGAPGSLQVHTRLGSSPAGSVDVEVWSDGPALDPSVEQHLFEPFFSSQSRSTGLGLFICRELCERHGAAIVYQRTERRVAAGHKPRIGNAFVIRIRLTQPAQETGADTILV